MRFVSVLIICGALTSWGDAGVVDAGVVDAGVIDAGPPEKIGKSVIDTPSTGPNPPTDVALGAPVPFSNVSDGGIVSVIEVEKVNTKPEYRYFLHDSMTLRARGTYAATLRAQYPMAQPGTLVTLVLDGIQMSNLDYVMTETRGSLVDGGVSPSNDVLITFALARDSNDDANRKAWDTLLTKHRSYEMKVPVYLSVANGLAQAVQTNKITPTLLVGNIRLITTVMWSTLIAILAAFAGLIFSDVLRDSATGYYSLGKSQMAFWGVLVFACVLAVFIVTGTLEKIPEQTLGLLGISGATGLGSLLIGTGLENKGLKGAAALRAELNALKAMQSRDAVQEARFKELVEMMSARRFLKDICDDGNGLSFHRVQVVVWTVLLGFVFVRAVAQTMSMPEFPESLLLLMGISNATYLGFKFPEKPPA